MPHESQIFLDHRSGYRTLTDWFDRVMMVPDTQTITLPNPSASFVLLDHATVKGHLCTSGKTAYGNGGIDNYQYHCFAAAHLDNRPGQPSTAVWLDSDDEILNQAQVFDTGGTALTSGGNPVIGLVQKSKHANDGAVIGGNPSNAQLTFCTLTGLNTVTPVVITQDIRVQMPLAFNERARPRRYVGEDNLPGAVSATPTPPTTVQYFYPANVTALNALTGMNAGDWAFVGAQAYTYDGVWRPVSSSGTLTHQSLPVTSVNQTAFSLAATPTTPANTQAVLGHVPLLYTRDFTVVGTTLTLSFTDPPRYVGETLDVWYD